MHISSRTTARQRQALSATLFVVLLMSLLVLLSVWNLPSQPAFAATVAKTWYYPKQDTAIHTIEGKQLWAVTIAGKPNHTNRDSNTSFPHEAGEHGASAVATATPRLRPYRTQA